MGKDLVNGGKHMQKKVKLKRSIVALTSCFTILSSGMIYAAEPISSAIPTSQWTLDNNNYHFSAYINGYKLYSNYYFYTKTAGRFHFFANEYDGYSSNGYSVGVVNRSNGATIRKYVAKSETGFSMYHTDYSTNMGNYFYFFIDGSGTGAEVSLDGYMNTY